MQKLSSACDMESACNLEKVSEMPVLDHVFLSSRKAGQGVRNVRRLQGLELFLR
jgi:hypothetical protein